MFAVLHLFNKNYSGRQKADRFVTKNKIIIIILFLFFSIPACYQKDLWENYYTIPDVTITSANATVSTITFNWTYPPITDMKALNITCTDTTTGIVVHTDSIVQQSIVSHSINSGLTSGQRYNINMRITDKWGKSSPGFNFAILTQAGNMHFIYSTDDLNAVRGGIYAGWNPGDTYNLMEDLDLSDPDYYNAGLGWEPISTFTGIFEGNGHIIRNLMINRGATNRVGLFGIVDTGGIIRNVNLVNVNVQGNQYVGGLIAYCQNSGPVSGCSVTGIIKGSADSVGGLIAYNLNCNVSSSYSNVTIEGAGSFIGGLIGICYTTQITNCYSICSVKATGISTYGIGGLVGNCEGTITGSYARGTITATASGIFSVGGLAGNGSSTMISNSYAEVNISNTSNWTGGLVGYIRNNAAVTIIIDNCHATGSVNSNSYSTGGLIGYMRNSVAGEIILQNNCYASGSISGTTETGGLIGYSHNETTGLITLTDCYASGAVSGTTNVGGFIGYNHNASTGSITLTSCNHTTGTVTGTSATGGLVGNNSGDIANCSSSGIVNGAGNTGGLVGHNSTTTSSIDLSSSSCTVTGTGGNVGGLVGWCEYTSPTNSHATGNVTGYSINVGGLAGYKQSLMINCYATGHVTGYGNDTGGLIGRNQSGNIDTSWSTGNVTGYGNNTGGLVGVTQSGDINSSWATGNVTVTITTLASDNCVGGLVGYCQGNITGAYATGNVNATYTSTSGGTVNVYVGGLIGFVNGAVSISKSSATGIVTTSLVGTGIKNINVGGLIGENFSGIISLCYFDGELYANSGTATVTYAGGLVGRLSAGSIDYSFSNGIVRANTPSNQGTGGFVGYHFGGTGITNSYSLCNVQAAGTNVGGFVGMNDNFTTITRSYSAGQVGGAGTQGGFCGTNTGTITFSFYDQDVSGHSDAGKGDPVSPSTSMQYPNDDTTTYTLWNFIPLTGVWIVDPVLNNRYPYFQSNWPY